MSGVTSYVSGSGGVTCGTGDGTRCTLIGVAGGSVGCKRSGARCATSNLPARPSTSCLDGSARSVVRRVCLLEERKDVLRAIRCPEREGTLVLSFGLLGRVHFRRREERLTTPSSATGAAGAAPAQWGKGGGRKQGPLALLGIYQRTTVASIPVASAYRRLWRKVPEKPQTLGEHLRKARIDGKMTIVQAAHVLGVAYQTVEKWEHNRKPVGPKSRANVIAFIGHDPTPTAEKSNT